MTQKKTKDEIAQEALEDAKRIKREGESSVQPVYKTQKEIGGKNIHRDKDAIISEFDDPAANIVKR